MRRKKRGRSAPSAKPSSARALALYAVEPLERRVLLTTIVSGQTIDGLIATDGQKDTYVFTATAGQSFEASLGVPDSSDSSGFLPDLTIYNPSGREVSGQSTGATDSSVQGLVGDAVAGTYSITVQSDAPSNTGSYALELDAAPANQATDADGDGGAIASGQTKFGTINRPGDLDVYTFTATAGQSFEASLGVSDESSAFLPEMTIYDPTGRSFGSGNTGVAHSSVQVLASRTSGGTYTIIVQSDSPTNTGTYALELDAAPATQAADADGDGGAIASGQTKFGTINRSGDLDAYTFTAIAGQSFEASLGVSDGSSAFLPEMTIYDPSGQLVGSNYNGNSHSSIQELLDSRTSTGTYTIIVQSDGPTNTGTYALELDAAPATQAADTDGDGGPLLSGKIADGTINRPGDIDVYTFQASAGDAFQTTVGNLGTSGYQPDYLVIDPSGNFVVNAYTPATNTSLSNTYSVPSGGGGTYTIIVQSDGGSSTGAYYVDVTGNLLLSLANLSEDVYSATPRGYPCGGFEPLEPDNEPNNAGYFAEAYQDADLSQIVVAIRGTVLKPNETGLDDVAEDTSFLTSLASPLLTSEVADAASFVACLHCKYPAATIVLTGHSLGGAVAQLLGKASRFKTEVFNAPGSGALYSQLLTQLTPVINLGSDGTNINFRLYGDQVSLAGAPIGAVVTLQDPVTTSFITIDPTNEALNFLSNLYTFYNLHSIATVVSQIQANALFVTSGEDLLNDVAALEGSLLPDSILVSTGSSYLYHLTLGITASMLSAGNLIDPLGGSDFNFAVSGSSPDVSSVALPNFANVASYSLRYEVGSTWSSYQTVLPSATYTFAQPADAIEFLPLDASGQSTTIADSFFLEVHFASTGNLSGTLSSDPMLSFPSWLSLGPNAVCSLDNNILDVTNGTVTLLSDAGAAAPGLNVEASEDASIVFDTTQHLANLTLNDAATATLQGSGTSVYTNGLSIAPAARLDVGHGELYVSYSGVSPLSTIEGYIARGYDGGKWDRPGIITSAGGVGSPFALGYADGSDGVVAGLPSGEILVKATYYGDANLDGTVDINDLNIVLSNYLSGKPTTWDTGDFNYDGQTDINDLNAVLSNYLDTVPMSVQAASTPDTAVHGTSSVTSPVITQPAASIAPAVAVPSPSAGTSASVATGNTALSLSDSSTTPSTAVAPLMPSNTEKDQAAPLSPPTISTGSAITVSQQATAQEVTTTTTPHHRHLSPWRGIARLRRAQQDAKLL